MNPTSIRFASLCLSLALPLSLAAQNPGPIPAWFRAPGAQQHFNGNATAWEPANAFLAMAHATLTGPTDVGFSSWSDTATMRSIYQDRVRSILQSGRNASYGSTGLVAASWGYGAVSFFRSALTDTEGYIASSGSHTIIAFRGSELSDLGSFVQDWFQTDFNALPITLRGSDMLPAGFVHAGFAAGFLSVRDQILQQLNDFHGYAPRFAFVDGRLVQVRSTKPIWTTGYSLGGALATVGAFLLRAQTLLPVAGAITGGAPMVGSSGFATLYTLAGLQLYRHENNCEIVPLAPGELARLPGDATQTAERVGTWVASQFPEPVRSPMVLLAAAVVAPANWIADGISTVNDVAAAANANYVHFGVMRYWDRNAAVSLNPSANTRQNDRERTFTAGITNVLDQFLPPAPPTNPYDAAAWATYFARLADLAGRVWNAVTNPAPYIQQIGSTFAQYVTDHSSVKQSRLLFDVLPDELRGIATLPKRP
jgi:hypothetical protein